MEEPEIILAESGSPRRRLRVSLKQYKGQPLFNIRYFYEDKKTGEMRATAKGIAVTRNNFEVIANTLSKDSEAISDFMENGVIGDTIATWEQKKLQALQHIGAVNEIETAVRPIPGRDFMEVDYEGSKAKVALNSNHEKVALHMNNSDCIKILESIAVAFDLSQKLIVEDESNEVQHALERFRTEFSRQLKNLPI
jgi:hypothetical protein